MSGKSGKYGYLYLLAVFTIWGSLYVVSKYVLGKLPVFTISFVRFALGFFTLSLAGRKASRKAAGKGCGRYILFIGIAGYFLAVGAQLLGTKYAGASMASLINALNPVTMTGFAAILLHERLTPQKAAGILLAVAGVYVILGKGGQTSVTGICLSLFSVLLWSLVSVITREASRKYDSLSLTRWSLGLAALLYLPVSLYEVGSSEIHLDASCVLGLLYMGIVCTGLAYLLWNKSLSILEAGTCSAFYPIQPLVSALLGILFLGEQVGLSFWLGAILIAVGVRVEFWDNHENIHAN